MDKQPSSKGMTFGLALLTAVAGAGWSESFEGFVLGGVLGALFAQILFLRGRAQSLAEELRQLRAAQRAAEPTTADPRKPAQALRAAPAQTPQPAPVAAAEPAEAQPSAARAAPSQTATPTRALESGARPQLPPRRPPEPSPIERAFQAGVAWLKRGNPLARLGLVILFIGAAFLAQYAESRGLVPIELRFIGLALGAFVLLFLGWRLRESRAVYAQLLQGGGVAGLYLTVFAATKLYQLLPLGLAFGLMVVIALAAAVLAVAQNALSLAVIGVVGGFLAPIFVSTGSGNHITLFSYYAILNLSIFAVAWFRTWRVLNVLGFLFTFTITGLWRASGYEPADLVSADAFLILFFLMYVGVSVLNSIRQPPNLKGYVSGSLVFGLPVVAFTLHATLVARIEYALAWSALALGVFYLVLGWTLHRTRRETFRLLVEAFAALGVIFASLAIPLAFDTRTTAAMWAVEGAGLLWLGARQQRRLARAFGALLQSAAGLGYLAGLPAAASAETAVLNSACLGALMLSVSGVCSGYWLHRNRERQAAYEAGGEYVFTLWGVAWWVFAGLNEIAHFLRPQLLGAALTFVAVTAALLAAVAMWRRWPLPRLIAAYMPAAALIPALLYTAQLHPFAEWGALGWLTLFAAHYGLLRVIEGEALAASAWLHAGACWALALVVAWEASWQIDARTTGVWSRLPWGLAPALLIAQLGARTLRPKWPAAVHAETYRVLAALPLVVAAALWIAVINLTSRGDASWLPYLPLLNPLDVGVALVFTAGVLWWTSLTEAQRDQVWPFDPRALIAVVAALAFLWLNAALIRTLHHNWGAPITAYGVANSTLVQSALSIFWSVLGFTAMTLAARQRWRYVWLVGAALMIVVVAKLFLVDLSNVGTVARITSFLSVGALLLITGYLAPLPPRREAEQA
jgi:uncharacterized membrane protein